jgi:hypothetical protein
MRAARMAAAERWLSGLEPPWRARMAAWRSTPHDEGPGICRGLRVEPERGRAYCTALIMSKIGRYMATTMPPTTTPRNTIITGSMRLSRFDTAASTSSS